jgi:hypothetical protein
MIFVVLHAIWPFGCRMVVWISLPNHSRQVMAFSLAHPFPPREKKLLLQLFVPLIREIRQQTKLIHIKVLKAEFEGS